MKTIDRAEALPIEVSAAITEAVKMGEPLMITERGVPRMQIVRPMPVEDGLPSLKPWHLPTVEAVIKKLYGAGFESAAAWLEETKEGP